MACCSIVARTAPPGSMTSCQGSARWSASGVLRDGIDLYADAELVMGERSARLECAFDRRKPRTAIVGLSRTHGGGRASSSATHATMHLAGATPREIDAPYEVDDFYGGDSPLRRPGRGRTGGERRHAALVVDPGQRPFSISCAREYSARSDGERGRRVSRQPTVGRRTHDGGPDGIRSHIPPVGSALRL